MPRLLMFAVLLPGPLSLRPTADGSESSPRRVHMANGVKVGEMTPTTAIVWTRLTREPNRKTDGVPFAKQQRATASEAAQLAGHSLDEMDGRVAGVAGEVRVVYWVDGAARRAEMATPWKAVLPEADFTRQFVLQNLQPGRRYAFRVEGRAAAKRTADQGNSRPVGSETQPPGDASAKNHLPDVCVTAGAFKTAPEPQVVAPVSFVVTTCHEYPRRDDPLNGHRIYPAMLKLAPDFLVHTGDIEYYDKPDPFATTVALARFKWNRIFALPFQRDFYRQTGAYFMKDDHDTLKDDAWPGQTYGDLTWEQGLSLFREQVPMGAKTHRTVRWGRDLQIWMVEGRDFRSPNKMPDGPDKTIWGAEQKKWFFETVKQSDATFRLLISPTPLVGPDRETKADNHANAAFAHEGRELRRFIGSQKNMAVLCGDRHWQYASVDAGTGTREFGCGPGSDAHAGGFSRSQRTAAHRYLEIQGGFLSVRIDRQGEKPRAVFRHYAVDGTVAHEEVLWAEGEARLPGVDLSGDTKRHVVIAAGTEKV